MHYYVAFQRWSTPAERRTKAADMSVKYLDLQAQEAVASHQWKKKKDLTTDDDHGILRLNNSCRVQSVTKTQRKKKVDSQKVDELYTANLRREKLWMQSKLKKEKKLVYKRKHAFAMSAWTTTKDSVLHSLIMLTKWFLAWRRTV